MISSILYFFLLVLKILLNFSLYAGYKQNRFFKIWTKKNFKFTPDKNDGFLAFDLSFMLLPTEIKQVVEK